MAQLLSEDPGISLSGAEVRSAPGRAALAMARSGSGGAVNPSERSLLAEAEAMYDREVRGAREVYVTVEE